MVELEGLGDYAIAEGSNNAEPSKAPNDRSASEQAHEALDQKAAFGLKDYIQDFLIARSITLEEPHLSALADAIVLKWRAP